MGGWVFLGGGGWLDYRVSGFYYSLFKGKCFYVGLQETTFPNLGKAVVCRWEEGAAAVVVPVIFIDIQ